MGNLTFFSDIDGILVQTEKHVKNKNFTEVYKTGTTSVVATPEQIELFNYMAAAGRLILVTARSPAQVEQLKNVYPVDKLLQICDYGLTWVNADEDVHEEFLESLKGLVSEHQHSLKLVVSMLSLFGRLSSNDPIIKTFSALTHKYSIMGIKVKVHPGKKYVIEDALKLYFKDLNVFTDGTDLFITPLKENYKRHAVEFLKSKDPAGKFIGLGDSETDLPFLQTCNQYVYPCRGLTYE